MVAVRIYGSLNIRMQINKQTNKNHFKICFLVKHAEEILENQNKLLSTIAQFEFSSDD